MIPDYWRRRIRQVGDRATVLKVGIIGTGVIAREHAAAIAMTPGIITMVAAADISSERLTDFCDAYQVARRYASAAELIADPEVQLVTVATPPSSHEESVVTALEAGKYVLCEKPLAHSLAGAHRIETVARRHPGRLSVSYQLRYDQNFRRMHWLAQNSWAGDIQSGVIERHSYIPQSDAKSGWWGSWQVAGGRSPNHSGDS